MATLGFAASIRLNSTAILQKVNKEVYRIAWELFTLVVILSPSPSNPGPFAKGLLSNQWYPSIGAGISVIGASKNDSGEESKSRINALTKSNGTEFLGKDGRLTLSNNTPYGYEAEVLGWLPPVWSGNAKPYRMVAKSLVSTAARNKKIRINT